MRTDATLRKFGWKQSKGKWIAPGHSRPLTLSQAKNALARDLGAKDFAKAKATGKVNSALSLVQNGFLFDAGNFYTAKGRKALSLTSAQAELAKAQAKQQRKAAKELGFRSLREQEKVEAFYESDAFLNRFYLKYLETHGSLSDEIKTQIQILYYRHRRARTKRERQQALNDLLILVGYRTGNEPYPAGQTPKPR